jgi:hypothetical protein
MGTNFNATPIVIPIIIVPTVTVVPIVTVNAIVIFASLSSLSSR